MLEIIIQQTCCWNRCSWTKFSFFNCSLKKFNLLNWFRYFWRFLAKWEYFARLSHLYWYYFRIETKYLFWKQKWIKDNISNRIWPHCDLYWNDWQSDMKEEGPPFSILYALVYHFESNLNSFLANVAWPSKSSLTLMELS